MCLFDTCISSLRCDAILSKVYLGVCLDIHCLHVLTVRDPIVSAGLREKSLDLPSCLALYAGPGYRDAHQCLHIKVAYISSQRETQTVHTAHGQRGCVDPSADLNPCQCRAGGSFQLDGGSLSSLSRRMVVIAS